MILINLNIQLFISRIHWDWENIFDFYSCGGKAIRKWKKEDLYRPSIIWFMRAWLRQSWLYVLPSTHMDDSCSTLTIYIINVPGGIFFFFLGGGYFLLNLQHWTGFYTEPRVFFPCNVLFNIHVFFHPEITVYLQKVQCFWERVWQSMRTSKYSGWVFTIYYFLFICTYIYLIWFICYNKNVGQVQCINKTYNISEEIYCMSYDIN